MLKESTAKKESNGTWPGNNNEYKKRLIFHRHVAPARYSMGSFYRKEIGQSTSY
jgi:hypothetical protein